MQQELAQSIVGPFYDALNQPASKDVATLVEKVTSPEWRSYSGETTSKGRDEFIQQVKGFGKMIPDLSWAVREVLVAGDKVIVRSEASGTPAGDFMGVAGGGRRFSIMTIDIHTIRDNRLVTAHHVEDWASALRQLAGR
ncbi:MAG: ester cyclase [Polyangiaceae bacterium]